MTPKFSLSIPVFAPDDPGSWQPLFNRARAADRAGVDRIALAGDHVAFGENLDAYSLPKFGGRADDRRLSGSDAYHLEPMTTLAVLCGLTSRVRLTTLVLVAALRRPVVMAKTATTVDVLSGGRLDLGVGVGWQREEYEAAGLDFDRRGRLLDHTLEVCEVLWREQRAGYSSPELSFEAIHMMPKPVGPNGVPVWVSGTVCPPAMRRLARFGCGWIPWGRAWTDPEVLVATIPRMREAVTAYGRDPNEIEVVGWFPIIRDANGTPAIGASMDRIAPLVEAGVTDLRAQLPVPSELNAAEDYLSKWVTAFRDATS